MSIPNNPARAQFQSDPLGSIISVSDGQTREVVQLNGILNGEVLLTPSYALLNGLGLFASVSIPGLTDKCAISLNAKTSAGVNLFTAGISGTAVLLLANTIGIARVKTTQEPPRTKYGWQDSANFEATKFLAMNITKYSIGQAIGIGKDMITILELPDGWATSYGNSIEPQIGDLVMAGWEHANHFPYVVPLLKRNTETAVATEAVTGDVVLAKANVVEIESMVQTDDQASAIGASTLLVPNQVATEEQIKGAVVDVPATDTIDITYKYFDLGSIIPLSQMWKLVVGKIMYRKGNRIAVDLGRFV